MAVSAWKQKVTDYNQLVKTRLTFLVVLSAVITYATASFSAGINAIDLVILAVGGFLVTGAANGINQIIEKNYDKLMVRTANRPVATNRMSNMEAALASSAMGVAGVIIIATYLNALAGFIAFVSLVLYAFIYTPMKRISPISVFVGAFPGALPVLIGYTAFSNQITYEALILFGVQFFWQFPHFWSIAWILDDDYKRAGFKMLPTHDKDKTSALITLAFTVCLLPIGLMPTFEGFSGITSGIIAIAGGLVLSYFAWRLYQTCDNKDAKRLMFASFLYLPLVQFAYLFDKI
ncbi:MAG: protoheme IX farnesyltransferase [Bacteroidetes bacterium]|nr:MAG: protoheme IX farnesyltransferase [Bacteroidota bacterium]